MKQLRAVIFIGFVFAILYSCDVKMKKDTDFGAYYTTVITDNDFEQYSRTGDYPDIIVDLGSGNGQVVFWRGSSFLPFWQNANGEKFYFKELLPRHGDGSSVMPDRVNTYSHVKIIESSDDKVIIHWRYLQNFGLGNPDKGVDPEGFADEYFTFLPDGEVQRFIRQGRDKADDWNNPGNVISQTAHLSKKGISEDSSQQASININSDAVRGSDIIEQLPVKPIVNFDFDEGIGDATHEKISMQSLEVKGRKILWRKGVSGTCLQFDGYNTEVRFHDQSPLTIKDEISLQAYVALAAYPWSWCPIIQQCDDVVEEIEMVQKGVTYHVEIKTEDDKGFFLGINGDGNPGFKLRVGGVWNELTGNIHLERRQWYLITATYSRQTGEMNIFVDDQNVGQKRINPGDIELSEKDIIVGRGKPRRPINPVRRNTFPGQYALDGLIDEVKVYNIALDPDLISNNSQVAKTGNIPVNMDKRVLPSGEKIQQFGSYYDHLKFYDVWDNLWCFSEHPDIIVGFDNNPSKFIFWRGVSYIPMMVNKKGQWYSNEFNETWGTSGGDGCQEPMSDKGNYFTYARIIENTPARVVVHYRFPLADVNLVKANYLEETGWYDVADWYYYIYPDGIASKQMRLWTSGNRNHEWQESMAIFGPDQHPEDIIAKRNTVTMLDMDGNSQSYDWITGPPPDVGLPKDQYIQIVNYTGDYDPVTIGEAFEGSNVYGGELTPYSVFPTWNHWPIAQMPSDGRYASYADRTGHSSLTHVYLPVYDEGEGDKPFYEKLLMEGMLDTGKNDLVSLAKSWNRAPDIEIKSEGKAWYEKPQRAYIVENTGSSVELVLKANSEQPLYNICVIVEDWGNKEATSVLINGSEHKCRQGIVRDTDGSYKLVVWVEMKSEEGVVIEILD